MDDYVGEPMSTASVAVLCSLYAVSTLVGVCGSGLLIFTLLSDSKFRHESSTFVSYLLNLMATDLFFQLYFFPLLTAGLLIGRYPVAGHAHCVVNGFLLFVSSIVFMFTLAAISIDRYVLVCHRPRYGKFLSRKVSVAICLLIWVAAGLVSAPSAADGTLGFDPKIHLCFLQQRGFFTLGHGVTIVVVLVTMVGVGLPNFFIYRAYRTARARVAPAVRRDVPEMSSTSASQKVSVSRSDIALLRSLLTIFLAFFLLTFPATVFFTIRGSVYISPLVYGLSIWLYAVNSSINWIIYGIMNSRFRSGYTRAVQRLRSSRAADKEDDGKTTEDDGKTTGRQREDDGKTTGRRREDDEKTTGRRWEDDGKTTGRQREDNGKTILSGLDIFGHFWTF
ncbi:hypothetical protein ACOMHN_022342 [Nucella lapillus]